jgi:hypothetical protein
VFSTAVAGGDDESVRGSGGAVLEKGFEEILGGVDGAGHTAGDDEGGDAGALVFRDEAEGEGEEAGVLRGMIGALAIAIDAAGGVEEFGLERGAPEAFAGGIVGVVGVLF